MRIAVAASVVAIGLVAPAAAQSVSDDEKQIRALIAKAGSGGAIPFTDDRIFWTGPYRRPVVGKGQKPEPIGGHGPGLGRVPGSERMEVETVRLEVAKSGDLAYEFSNATLKFETTDGNKVSAPISVLRAWRKEGDEWKVAAMFARPHHQDEGHK